MAIAPSKLGQFVGDRWHSDATLVQHLRECRLVRDDASDDDLYATLRRAREEHAALSPAYRPFNSKHERVRVFLAPFLTERGTAWAVPLRSLELPDEGYP